MTDPNREAPLRLTIETFPRSWLDRVHLGFAVAVGGVSGVGCCVLIGQALIAVAKSLLS